MAEITSALLVKALDGLSVRAQATANNIANSGSPGFRAQRVTFEEALAAAVRSGRPAASVAPRIETAEAGAGAVRVDLELATQSATALRYSALTDLLSRQLQLHSIAISSGR